MPLSLMEEVGWLPWCVPYCGVRAASVCVCATHTQVRERAGGREITKNNAFEKKGANESSQNHFKGMKMSLSWSAKSRPPSLSLLGLSLARTCTHTHMHKLMRTHTHILCHTLSLFIPLWCSQTTDLVLLLILEMSRQ